MSKLSRAFRKAEKWVSDHVPHTHERDKRAAHQAAQEQMQYYQDLKTQAAETRAETERMKAEEKKKIAAKRLKSLRRRRSGGGFSDDEGMSNKLG